eukprot:3424449-Pleurochrysis_carterae.AAC.1
MQSARGYTRLSAQKRSLNAADAGKEPSPWSHPRALAGRLVECAQRACRARRTRSPSSRH